jgi:hypothetical protein
MGKGLTLSRCRFHKVPAQLLTLHPLHRTRLLQLRFTAQLRIPPRTAQRHLWTLALALPVHRLHLSTRALLRPIAHRAVPRVGRLLRRDMKMTTSATVLGEVVAIRPLGWAARDVAVATRKLADEVLDATTTDVVTAQRVLVVILLGLVRPVADAVRAMVAASSTARSAKAGTVVATVLRRLRLDGRLQRESCLGSWQLPCRILIRPLSSVKSHARRKRFSRNGTQKPASNVSNARSAPLFRQRLRRGLLQCGA